LSTECKRQDLRVPEPLVSTACKKLAVRDPDPLVSTECKKLGVRVPGPLVPRMQNISVRVHFVVRIQEVDFKICESLQFRLFISFNCVQNVLDSREKEVECEGSLLLHTFTQAGREL
jgi:hypothetical protein